MLSVLFSLINTFVNYVIPLSSSDESRSSLSLLQETVREYEVAQLALDYIKTGESPVIKGKYKTSFVP